MPPAAASATRKRLRRMVVLVSVEHLEQLRGLLDVVFAVTCAVNVGCGRGEVRPRPELDRLVAIRDSFDSNLPRPHRNARVCLAEA